MAGRLKRKKTEYPVTTPEDVAGAIRYFRKMQGRTQSEIGDMVCMKQSTVSEAELHPEASKAETLFKLLLALNLKIVITDRNEPDESVTSFGKCDAEWIGPK